MQLKKTTNSTVPYEFNPRITHPLFLIRSHLFRSISQLALHLTGKLMDFGCGLKPYESLFNVDEYIGVDYKGEGETYDKSQVDVFYDGRHIPFPDHTFDSIFSSEVFEHIFNLPQIMKELHRVLKSGGKILVTCPFTMNEHEQPNDYARYTSFAIRQIFEQNGFRVMEYRKTGGFIEAVMQLRIIYWEQNIIYKIRKIPVLRSIARYTIFTLLNVAAIVFRRVFPDNRNLYLNNVLLAEKI